MVSSPLDFLKSTFATLRLDWYKGLYRLPTYFVPVENKLLSAIFTSSSISPVGRNPVLTGTRLSPQPVDPPVPVCTRYLTNTFEEATACGAVVAVAVFVGVGSSVGVALAVAVCVAVAVKVGVCEGVIVGVEVAVGGRGVAVAGTGVWVGNCVASSWFDDPAGEHAPKNKIIVIRKVNLIAEGSGVTILSP